MEGLSLIPGQGIILHMPQLKRKKDPCLPRLRPHRAKKIKKKDNIRIVAPVAKKPPANAGDSRDTSSIPGLGRSPGGGNDNPLQYSCLENSMDRRSLVGYSPWGQKESDMTEHMPCFIYLHVDYLMSHFSYWPSTSPERSSVWSSLQ